jgi:PAS domain S-box-containing protein
LSKDFVHKKSQKYFEHEAEKTILLVKERLRKYEDMLWSGAAYIHTKSGDVSYDNWKDYAKGLNLEERYPGINGLGVIYKILPENLPAFLEEKKKERKEFYVYPRHSRNIHLPVVYLEPEHKHKKTIGLDIASEARHYEAAKKASESAEGNISAPIFLKKEVGHKPGFLFYIPFYEPNIYKTVEDRENNFVGLIYSSFLVKDLLYGALHRSDRYLDLKISDSGEVLYNEYDYEHFDYDKSYEFETHLDVDIYGRTWKFDVWNTLAFNKVTDNKQPFIILFSGLFLSFILFMAFIFLARRNREAFSFAQDMEKDYNKKSASLIDTLSLNESIITNAVDGLIVIDTKGTLESFNPACEKMFGYSFEEVKGCNIKMLMPEPYQSKHDGHLHKYEVTGKKTVLGKGIEVEGRRKNGDSFPLEVSVSEIYSGKVKKFFGVLRDISDRKEMETMRDEFISTVNHELRTPLTSIQGSLGLLKAKIFDSLDEKGQKLLTLSYYNCERLAHLVNDILNMEKIAAGKMEYFLEAVDVNPFIQDIIARNQSYGDKYDVLFKFAYETDKITCFVDKNRFEQALVNVLSNAAKFSLANTEVIIRADRISDEEVEISIKDTGEGIPEAFKDKIFGKFTQANSSSTRSKGGTGLGLNITKSIIEAFGGTVRFDSQEGKGTTFYFNLPITDKK